MNSNVILDKQFTNNQFDLDNAKQRLMRILNDEGTNPISTDLNQQMASANSDYQNEIWFWSYSMEHPAPFDNSDFYFSNYRMIMSFRNNNQLHFITSVFLFNIQKITFDNQNLTIETKHDQFKLNYNTMAEGTYLKQSADLLRGACNQAKHAYGDYTSDLQIQSKPAEPQASQPKDVETEKTDPTIKADKPQQNQQTPTVENDEAVSQVSLKHANAKYVHAMPVASAGDIPDGFVFVKNYYTASSAPILSSTPQSYQNAMNLVLEDIQNEIKTIHSSAGFNFRTDYDVDLGAQILNIFAYIDICKEI